MGKIIFDLCTAELPPSDNHCYGQKGKIRFMFKEARDWKESMQQFLLYYPKGFPKNKIVWGKEENISLKPLKATVAFFLKRDRDVHGSGKLIFDTFQGIVYKNDSQFLKVEFLKFTDKIHPRVDITIEEI